MSAYYNEIDPHAAQWLRNLIDAGHIAPGYVDERSIVDVRPNELLGYTQCHFFAGIGIWSHALRRSGWSDDRPVWTGSCPCQPFSAAGQQKGFSDERHLWPVWFNLIRECNPPVVLGEQVASALDWLDLVQTDLEAQDYAFGASDLCAAGFGGAHIRQRLYFAGVGDADRARTSAGLPEALGRQVGDTEVDDHGSDRLPGSDEGRSVSGGLADAEIVGRRQGFQNGGGLRSRDCAKGQAGRPSINDGLGDRPHAPLLGRDAPDWLYCRDGKWRPVEPGTFPLAHEAPARVGRLRAYGNGLDAETATQFCSAVKEVIG